MAHDTALCFLTTILSSIVPQRHSPAKHSHRPASDYYSQSSGCSTSAMDWFLHSVGHKEQAHQQTTSNQPHHPVPVPQLHVRVHASMHSRQHVSLALFLPVAAAVILSAVQLMMRLCPTCRETLRSYMVAMGIGHQVSVMHGLGPRPPPLHSCQPTPAVRRL